MNLMGGNRILGNCVLHCSPSISMEGKCYKVLVSSEMFAGNFRAKAIRLVLYWTSGEFACRSATDVLS